MKRLCLAALILFAIPCQIRADIVITEVMSSSTHPAGTSNSDWFELTNNGPTAVDITGWTWDDDSAIAGTATFGSITQIAAGESILVTQETLGAEAAWRTDWNVSNSIQVVNLGATGIPGFSSNGDTINIFDNNSALVTSLTFLTATAGFTFERDALGNDLGLSVIGENGAYQASFNGDGLGTAGNDVGSPGVAAIPEPSCFALLMLGTGLMGVVRRRV